MTSQLYIHVGPHKTGSTFLQREVFPKISSTFLSQQIKCAEVLRMLNQNGLFRDFSGISKWVASLSSHGDKVILSNEDFFGPFGNSYWENKEYSETLASLFPNAKVIMVIRKQHNILESMYKQTLHIGWSIPKLRFICSHRSRDGIELLDQERYFFPTIRADCLQWDVFAENYVSLFGRENVKILVYEDLANNPEKFISEVCDFMGVEKIKIDSTQVANRSYSAISVKISYILNRFLIRPERLGGFVFEQPYFDTLTNTAKSGKYGGLALYAAELSRRCKLRWLLQERLDNICYRNAQIYDGESQKYIQSFYFDSNKRLAENFNLDIQCYGYY